MRNKTSTRLLVFLIGLFSYTQVVLFVGCVGISELVMFIVAPFLFLIDRRQLHKDGFTPVIVLTVLVALGGAFSSWYNNTETIIALKGLAPLYTIFCVVVVMHNLLRKDLDSLKWFIVGHALSLLIYIVAFHPAATMVGEILNQETEMIMQGGYFWTTRVRAIAMATLVFYYFKIPHIVSVVAPMIVAGVCLWISSSGRSQCLYTVLAGVLVLIGGKSRESMRRVGRHVFLAGFVVICAMLAVEKVYKYTASQGLLGEDAKGKYERQTETGDSALQIVMSGRQEFFTAVFAVIDNPIIGYGPRPQDEAGYYERFLERYGSTDALQVYRSLIARGYNIKQGVIPTHSHIMAFWVWFGIFGGIFWMYVLWLIFKFFKMYASAIPQWYVYFAYCIPNLLWDIFFSPFGWRVYASVTITCLIFAKAVYERRVRLPIEMELESLQYDRR